MNFKEYINKRMFKESPYPSGIFISSELDGLGGNNVEYQQIITTGKEIDSFILNNKEYKVYYKKDFGIDSNYFIDDTPPHIKAVFKYKKYKHNGYICTHMWRLKESNLKMNWILLDYFLTKLKLIFSDPSLTNKGEEFWKSLIEHNINNSKYQFGIYNIEEDELISYKYFEDFDNIWENGNISIWVKLND